MTDERRIAIVTRAEARAAGSQFYFPGRACCRGHLCDRRVLNGHCIECEREDGQKPEKKASRAKWQKTSEKRKNWHTTWRQKRRQRENELHRKRRAADVEGRREIVRRSVRLWRKRHPEEARCVSNKYRAARANAPGHYTADDIERISKDQRGRCAYCRCKLTAKNRQIDHIIAIARGGSNWPSNLQMACSSCNSTKGAKHPVDFAQSVGLLL